MSIDPRAYIYAFLSKVFSEALDAQTIQEIRSNSDLLSQIGEESVAYMNSSNEKKLQDELDVDYSSVFLMDNPPIESSVIDNKKEVLVGLQNPAMMFYYKSGFEFDLSKTHIQTPDHLSIEFAFMQNLVTRNDIGMQFQFLKQHLAYWVPPYMISIKPLFSTPFYRDLADFCTEFLISDFSYVKDQKNLGAKGE